MNHLNWDDPNNTLRRGFADLEAGRVSDFTPRNEPYCGVYWIITTCLTGIAIGIGFGGLLWLVLS